MDNLARISNYDIAFEAVSYSVSRLSRSESDPEVKDALIGYRGILTKLSRAEDTVTKGETRDVYICLVVYRDFLDNCLGNLSDVSVRGKTLDKKRQVNAAMRELKKGYPDIIDSIDVSRLL